MGPRSSKPKGKDGTTNTSTSGGGVCGSAKVDDHRNKTVTLADDVFFVDETGFLMTVSGNIKFITAEYVATRTAKNLSIHIP